MSVDVETHHMSVATHKVDPCIAYCDLLNCNQILNVLGTSSTVVLKGKSNQFISQIQHK